MTAISLIASALPCAEPPEITVEGVCCVTGLTGPTVARALAVKPSFTNLDLLRAPQSDRASVEAWRVLNHAPARQSLWFCDGHEFRRLQRTELRDLVLDGVSAPQWAGYATTSYKKHGALRAPVNTGGRQVWLFELLLVDCTDRASVAATWARLRAAQDSGIARPLIESLDISPAYMGKIGWRLWREFDTWARPRMASPLYQFLTYLLPSQEELKKGGTR